MSEPIQLSLGISLNDEATFANYHVVGDINRIVVEALQNFAECKGDKNLVIWGGRGSGLTHLLQACARRTHSVDQSMQYLPMRDLVGYSPIQVCEGLEDLAFVCLDGIDEICGNAEWEQAIFHLYNRLKDNDQRLLIASHTSPPALPIVLADLKSRILGSTVYHVEGLSHNGKSAALQARAQNRGMELSDEVTQFILNRAPRDMNELFTLLNRLDDASLQEQRKLTIPFVKKVLCL